MCLLNWLSALPFCCSLHHMSRLRIHVASCGSSSPHCPTGAVVIMLLFTVTLYGTRAASARVPRANNGVTVKMPNLPMWQSFYICKAGPRQHVFIFVFWYSVSFTPIIPGQDHCIFMFIRSVAWLLYFVSRLLRNTVVSVLMSSICSYGQFLTNTAFLNKYFKFMLPQIHHFLTKTLRALYLYVVPDVPKRLNHSCKKTFFFSLPCHHFFFHLSSTVNLSSSLAYGHFM